MILRHTAIMIGLGAMLGVKVYAQYTTTTDFYQGIKAYDLSHVINADRFLAEDQEGSKEEIERPEILGFIGNNYQRLFVHFSAVTRNPEDPYEYKVYGKTKTREIIRTFRGTLKIRQARLQLRSDLPNYKQGFVTCEVVLEEDQNQPSTGYFKGTLKSNFTIDNKGKFRYDGLQFVADGFSNNQFVGTWTSYQTKAVKKCHWGDYRIPESGDLDIGAGEFSVNKKYLKNGWLSYGLAHSAPNDAIVKSKAGKKRKVKHWWE